MTAWMPMIDAFLQQMMRDQHIPGLAIAIKQADKTTFENYYGYANLEHKVPVTAETVFEIASVTKLFTTQAILLLVQEGRINLDDRLKTYLEAMPSAWENVTIKHCLTHQSGIPGYTDVESYWKVTRSDKTHAEVLSLISGMPLKFEPGSRYAYDNTGFYLLGLLIEKISGTSYGDFLEARIFKPLHMTSTQVNNYTRIIPHRSQGYIYQDGGLTNKDFYSTSNTFSAGILLSTIRDLARWHSALFDDSILNAHFRQLWWSPYPSAAGNERDTNYSVGLGWFIVDSPLGQFLGHNGGILGFVASFLYFPKTNISAFVLCNAGQVTEPHHIAFEVIRRISH